MPRGGWRTALKVALGFAIGFGLWWATSDLYAVALRAPAEMILRASERPPVTRLRASDREIIVERSDFPARSARPGVPLNDLTFNFILLTALFAANAPVFSNHNVGGFLGSAMLLALTHVLALVTAIKSIYALQLGPWSAAHYGSFLRNFWGASAHFYRLVGMYAVAFALWWLLRPESTVAAARTLRRRRKRR